jgi:hypothetical protein
VLALLFSQIKCFKTMRMDKLLFGPKRRRLLKSVVFAKGNAAAQRDCLISIMQNLLNALSECIKSMNF